MTTKKNLVPLDWTQNFDPESWPGLKAEDNVLGRGQILTCMTRVKKCVSLKLDNFV